MSVPAAAVIAALLTASDGGLAPHPAFDAWLEAAAPVADGFDLPRAKKNGPVWAMADGVVEAAGDGGVRIQHVFYENHERRDVAFEADGLEDLAVKPGDVVRRGQRLARRSRGALEIDAAAPQDFARARGRLFVPQAEEVLVLVDSAANRARVYRAGVPEADFEVGFGQGGVPKSERGDLRTPWGMYFVVDKRSGTFGGDYGDFYGGVWVKVNYPNAYDAERGVDGGLITRAQADAIALDWRRRALTSQKTKLGGGIGFHAWAAEWDADAGTGLSWGCVVLHVRDAKDFFARVPLGAMVVIF